MAIVAVIEPDAEVTARGGALVIQRHGVDLRVLPPHEVEELHLYGGAELSRAGRNLLLAGGIDTLFLAMDGRVRGRLVAVEGRQAERRIAQYRVCADPAARVERARAIVVGKLRNQRALLLGRQRMLGLDAIADALAAIRTLARRAEGASDLDVLRGLEGQAASLYFGMFPHLLRNPAFRWNGRNRRPPRDPVNAALSFGYALLVARCESAVRGASLDPFLGLLHETGRGRMSLALDLAEPLRPAVDGLVLTLFNRRQLGPEDFGPPGLEARADDPGVDLTDAVYLGRVGREVLLRAWSRRLAERGPHPAREGDWTLAGLIRELGYAFARSFTDDAPLEIPEI